MKYAHINGQIEISNCEDFDIQKTLECGQCFRFDSDESGIYTGIAFGRVIRLNQREDIVYIDCSLDDFESVWKDYFHFDCDYAKIRSEISIDEYMAEATKYGKGIRILKQDAWETLCSFILSSQNNIPRIKKIISALCRSFGDKICKNDEVFYTFPAAEVLAKLNVEDLSEIRCGYRAKYLISAAKAVVSGTLCFEQLSQKDIQSVQNELMKLPGVGPKIANCVMLFGMSMYDAFPEDVWIKRATTKQYGNDFDPKIFHPYAGIAQQYIYYYSRNNI